MALAATLVAVAALLAGAEVARRRRAVRLNRCLHELRRPIQAMTLSLEGPRSGTVVRSCLEQLRFALDDLDAIVNRRPPRMEAVRLPLGELVAAAERRWSGIGGVEVGVVTAPGAKPDADPSRVASAIDNLIANALEHGTAPVRIDAFVRDGQARLEVRDGGPALRAVPASRERNPQRGHGLGLVGAAARGAGGSASGPRATPAGTTAGIRLPLARQ
jgi:signal transduction histidine kinase